MSNILTEIENDLWALIETPGKPFAAFVEAIGLAQNPPQAGWTISNRVTRIKSTGLFNPQGPSVGADIVLEFGETESTLEYEGGRARRWVHEMHLYGELTASTYAYSNLQEFGVAVLDSVEDYTFNAPQLNIESIVQARLLVPSKRDAESDGLWFELVFEVSFERNPKEE